jgi:hypothetical protein
MHAVFGQRTVSVRTSVLFRLDGAATDGVSTARPVNMTMGTTSFEKFRDEISEDTCVSRCVPYVSSGSPLSLLIMREEVGEGVRGSRDNRFSRNSSS